MLNKLPITILLLLGTLVKIWGQDLPTNQLNTLFSEIQKAYKTSNYNEYERLLLKADTLSTKNKKPLFKITALRKLAQLYSGTITSTKKDLPKALVYANNALDFTKEAPLNIKKIKEIEKLKAEHDTEKKAQEIELLRTQNKNQELKLRQNKTLIISSLISMFLLIIIGGLFLRNKIIQTQADKLLLEQQLLRSQMNPHFIFNALSNIQTSILKNENQKAAIYLAKFSKLVRSILENTKKRTISFSEELEATTHYLELQKSRFENAFNYKITVDSEINQDFTMIPTMLFQPIIENAIEHGIESVESGMIDITFSLKKKHIICTVIDNGIGYSNTHTVVNKSKTSISNVIIKNRLSFYSKKLQYPLKYCIKDYIKNKTVIGTIATLDIPIIYN